MKTGEREPEMAERDWTKEVRVRVKEGTPRIVEEPSETPVTEHSRLMRPWVEQRDEELPDK